MCLRPLLLLVFCLITAACAAKKPEPQPKPQTIHLRSDASVSNPVTGGPPVAKNLFNIVVSKSEMTVNGAKVRDLPALQKLLAAHKQPAITIAAHKCLEREKAAEILSLAQRHTDTPIAFGSFGKFDDPDCAR